MVQVPQWEMREEAANEKWTLALGRERLMLLMPQPHQRQPRPQSAQVAAEAVSSLLKGCALDWSTRESHPLKTKTTTTTMLTVLSLRMRPMLMA